jgi:predicted DsbA family dithiol-disulfide isomerase
VRWLPFQLNPDIPEEGISRQAYIESKFGPGAKRNYARIEDIGRSVGIDFTFDAITVQPNTVLAHRLMHYGSAHGRGDETAEAIFRAYFLDGKVLTDRSVLCDIGEAAGLDRAALERYFASDEDADEVREGDINARRSGINGVPFFIFNRRVAVSGAHEPETLLEAMEKALAG